MGSCEEKLDQGPSAGSTREPCSAGWAVSPTVGERDTRSVYHQETWLWLMTRQALVTLTKITIALNARSPASLQQSCAHLHGVAGLVWALPDTFSASVCGTQDMMANPETVTAQVRTLVPSALKTQDVLRSLRSKRSPR